MGQSRSRSSTRGIVGFVMVPRAIILDPTLSDAAKVLACALVSFAWQDGSCFPGQERLAAVTGWSVKKVQRTLSELERKGYIRRKRRGYMKTNRYVLLFDPSGGHGCPVIQDTSVAHDATPVSHYYNQLPRHRRLESVLPDNFSSPKRTEKKAKSQPTPNREEVVRQYRAQLESAGGGPDMEGAVAVALGARLKCSLEEAFQLLGGGQGSEGKA